MLRIVTGRVGQAFQIGYGIEVTVKTVIGGQVWAEITGPDDVRVRQPINTNPIPAIEDQ